MTESELQDVDPAPGAEGLHRVGATLRGKGGEPSPS